jgi:hypothetical protein
VSLESSCHVVIIFHV